MSVGTRAVASSVISRDPPAPNRGAARPVRLLDDHRHDLSLIPRGASEANGAAPGTSSAMSVIVTVDHQPGAGRARRLQYRQALFERHQMTRRMGSRGSDTPAGRRRRSARSRSAPVPALRRVTGTERCAAPGASRRARSDTRGSRPGSGHRAAQQPERQREGLLRAVRDEDLVRQCRQPAPGEPLGDGGPQLRDSVGVIAGVEARRASRTPASAKAAASSASGAPGAAMARSITPSSAGKEATLAGRWPAGSSVQVPAPRRLRANPSSRSRSYAAVTVALLTVSAEASSRSAAAGRAARSGRRGRPAHAVAPYPAAVGVGHGGQQSGELPASQRPSIPWTTLVRSPCQLPCIGPVGQANQPTDFGDQGKSSPHWPGRGSGAMSIHAGNVREKGEQDVRQRRRPLPERSWAEWRCSGAEEARMPGVPVREWVRRLAAGRFPARAGRGLGLPRPRRGESSWPPPDRSSSASAARSPASPRCGRPPAPPAPAPAPPAPAAACSWPYSRGNRPRPGPPRPQPRQRLGRPRPRGRRPARPGLRGGLRDAVEVTVVRRVVRARPDRALCRLAAARPDYHLLVIGARARARRAAVRRQASARARCPVPTVPAPAFARRERRALRRAAPDFADFAPGSPRVLGQAPGPELASASDSSAATCWSMGTISPWPRP